MEQHQISHSHRDMKSQESSANSVETVVIFLLVIVWSHSLDLVVMQNT